MSIYLCSCIVTLVTQITYAIQSSTYAHIARPLNITFLLLAISSLHLMGFESSLINFTCPHFCPQLFIGPYYENLNLLFDYWLLPLEDCGFLCIIEQSLSYTWLLHTRIKVLVFRMSNHLAEESFCLDAWICFKLSQKDLGVQSVWRKKLVINFATLHFLFFFKLNVVALLTGLFY